MEGGSSLPVYIVVFFCAPDRGEIKRNGGLGSP